jgi:uncharacterized protein YmfQ (DUF2313 family)
MAMTSEQYRQQLWNLMPRGLAWKRDGIIDKLLAGLAVELSRIDAEGDNLIHDICPSDAVLTLEDWERVCGLPNECFSADYYSLTIKQREAIVCAWLTLQGGASIQVLEDMAAALGYTVKIEEISPFRVNRNRMTNALWGNDVKFSYLVHLPTTTIIYFRTGHSSVGDRLERIQTTGVIECFFGLFHLAGFKVYFRYDL